MLLIRIMKIMRIEKVQGINRFLSVILEQIEQDEGCTNIWESIKDVINKTLVTVQPSLSHAYKT